MYNWNDLNLPSPLISSYSYESDAGLVRTPMTKGYSRQRRKYTHNPHYFNITLRVTLTQLQSLTETINTYCYDWVYMPLTSGANGLPCCVDHIVRFISNTRSKSIGGLIYELSGVVEMQEATPACTFVANCDEYLSCLLKVDIEPVLLEYNDWATLADAWGDSTYWGWLNS